MPRTYEKPGAEALRVLEEVLSQWHSDLVKAKVRIDLIMVSPSLDVDDNPTGSAIIYHGHAASAKVRLVNRRQRLYRQTDVEIELDARAWMAMTQEQGAALLDHELEHVVVKRGLKSGQIEYDVDDRPKLRLKLDDYMLTGFVDVADRHGENAIEVASVRVLWDKWGQALFPWAMKAPKKKTKHAKVA